MQLGAKRWPPPDGARGSEATAATVLTHEHCGSDARGWALSGAGRGVGHCGVLVACLPDPQGALPVPTTLRLGFREPTRALLSAARFGGLAQF